MFCHSLAGYLLVSMFISVPFTGGAPKDPRPEIEARYVVMNKAYVTKNVRTLETLFSPNCKIKQQSEPIIINAKQFIQATKGLLVTTKVKSSKTKIAQIKTDRDRVIVKVVWSAVSWLTKDPRTFKNIPAKPRNTQQTIQDTWVKSGSKWLIQSRLVLE